MSKFLPPSDVLTALLEAAHAEPEEYTSRLVLADYLEEHDDPRGTMIRACCDLARLTPAEPRWHEARVELHRWEEEQRAGWLGKGRDFGFTEMRGLVTLHLSGSKLVSTRLPIKVRSALEQGWVGKVKFGDDVTDPHLQESLVVERLRRVPALEVSEHDGQPPYPGMGVRGLTNAGVAALQGLTGLRELTLPGPHWGRSRDLGDGSLAALADLPHLERLRVCISNRTGTALGRLARLRALDLESRQESRTSKPQSWPDLKEVASLPHLEHLRVRSSPALYQDFPLLSGAVGLRSLRLPGVRQAEDLANLAKLPRLRKLTLENVNNLTGDWPDQLAGADGLEELEVGGWKLSRKGVAAIASTPRLTTLRLWGLTNLTKDTLSRLGTLPALRDLSFPIQITRNYYPQQEHDLDDEGLAALCRLPNLEQLDLSGAQRLTAAGLAHLVELPRLRVLNLGNNKRLDRDEMAQVARLKLTYLNLERCSELGDRGLAPLAGMSGLTALSLGGCGSVGNNSLEPLHELKSLRYLDLAGCGGVTPSGVERLQAALPDCWIVHSPGSSRW